MLLEKYQEAVKHLMFKGGEFIPDAIIGLGLAGELGELYDEASETSKLTKNGDKEGVMAGIKKEVLELGDLLWYVAALATAHDINLAEVDIDNAPAQNLSSRILTLCDRIKKAEWHGVPMDGFSLRMDLAVILSSMREYLRVFDNFSRVSLEDTAARNVDKLKRRYPEGFVEGGGFRA